MKFLLGNKRLLIIDLHGLRIHKAPDQTHFETAEIKGVSVHVVKPDAINKTMDQMTSEVVKEVSGRSINQALQFHADRTEELLKRVLRAENSSEAAEMVADEIRSTEEQMQERQEGMKV